MLRHVSLLATYYRCYLKKKHALWASNKTLNLPFSLNKCLKLYQSVSTHLALMSLALVRTLRSSYFLSKISRRSLTVRSSYCRSLMSVCNFNICSIMDLLPISVMCCCYGNESKDHIVAKGNYGNDFLNSLQKWVWNKKMWTSFKTWTFKLTA